MATRLETLTKQFKAAKDRQKKDMLRFQIQGEVTRVLASTLDQYSDCLDQIVDTVSAIMGAERVSLLVRRRNFLEIASAVGMSEDTLQKRNLIRIGQGIAGKVAETGEPVHTPIRGATSGLKCLPPRSGPLSALAVETARTSIFQRSETSASCCSTSAGLPSRLISSVAWS